MDLSSLLGAASRRRAVPNPYAGLSGSARTPGGASRQRGYGSIIRIVGLGCAAILLVGVFSSVLSMHGLEAATARAPRTLTPVIPAALPPGPPAPAPKDNNEDIPPVRVEPAAAREAEQQGRSAEDADAREADNAVAEQRGEQPGQGAAEQEAGTGRTRRKLRSGLRQRRREQDGDAVKLSPRARVRAPRHALRHEDAGAGADAAAGGAPVGIPADVPPPPPRPMDEEPARLPSEAEEYHAPADMKAPSELPLAFRDAEPGEVLSKPGPPEDMLRKGEEREAGVVDGSDAWGARKIEEERRTEDVGAEGKVEQVGSAVTYPSLGAFMYEQESTFHLPLPATWALRPDAQPAAYRMERPTVWHDAMRLPTLPADADKANAVRNAFLHAWNAYEKHAWGRDTLKPISKRSDDGFLHMGITIVDSLDTLHIMGLHEQFSKAVAWTKDELRFGYQEDINTFETTIRVVGGILAAWDLDGRRDGQLLAKARELANQLAVAFESPTGVPYGTVGLGSKRKHNPPWVGGSSISEVATLQMEWEYLSHVTRDPKYALFVRRVMAHLQTLEAASDSLYGMFISPDSGHIVSSTITLGARGDSLYEYLLKQYLLAGGTDGYDGVAGNAALIQDKTPVKQYAPTDSSRAGASWREAHLRTGVATGPQANPYQCTDTVVDAPACPGMQAPAAGRSRPPSYQHFVSDESSKDTEAAFFASVLGMYYRSMSGVERELVRVSKQNRFVYIAERHGGSFDDKMDHLLAAHHMELARGLMRTCVNMYNQTATGLAAEITRFPDGNDPIPDPGAKHNLLRPETVESLMIMYRITGDQAFRDAGWQIFSAFEKWSRVPDGGYSTIRDVTHVPPELTDNQESFFLAETLKYLYLLFSDSALVPLNEWVFNTEAHPLRVFSRSPK